MAHYCTHIYIHLVFATKHRQPFIDELLRVGLESYISGVYAAHRHSLLTHYAMPDHYHGLFRLHPAESVSELVRRIKGGSAFWLNKNHFPGNFEWQTGYGAFGHLAGNLKGIMHYIKHQPERHRSCSLVREVEILNKKYGADWVLD